MAKYRVLLNEITKLPRWCTEKLQMTPKHIIGEKDINIRLFGPLWGPLQKKIIPKTLKSFYVFWQFFWNNKCISGKRRMLEYYVSEHTCWKTVLADSVNHANKNLLKFLLILWWWWWHFIVNMDRRAGGELRAGCCSRLWFKKGCPSSPLFWCTVYANLT